MVKAVSWRALGSIDTFLLSWLFTSNITAAGAIASTEVLTKMVLYYLHERVWSTVHWGTTGHRADEEALRPAPAQASAPASTGDDE